MGRFITFEGIEGCGKTTQVALAAAYLEGRSIACTATAEPGGTTLGARIRELLLQPVDNVMCAETEVLLFAADRAQHTRNVILPARARGRVVLCDRFTDATLAYQGFGRGLDMEFLRTLNRFSGAGLRPDVTILFDLPVEEGLRRVAARGRAVPGGGEDRIEGEKVVFHERIRQGYLQLAREEADRFRVIDAAAPIDRIHHEVRRHLDLLFGEA